MSGDVVQPKTHRVSRLGLHAGNVGDRRYMVIVKSVPKPQHCGRYQRQIHVVHESDHERENSAVTATLAWNFRPVRRGSSLAQRAHFACI